MKKAAAWIAILMMSRLPKADAQVPPPLPGTEVMTLAAPQTVWCKLGLSHHRWRKCCETPLGQFVNGVLAPVRFASGGLVSDCCAKPLTKEELARMVPGEVSPGEIAAARIRSLEAGAAARRAAIRYLGTVDCHWYPEAEAALIAGLRSDQNECVRLEAALALGNGCCCTKNTIEKLQIVVQGSDEDGNPVETSERVKMAAWAALQHCLFKGVRSPTPALIPAPLPAPEKTPFPPEPKAAPHEGVPAVNFPPLSTRPESSGLQLLSGAADSTLPKATATERAFAETVGVRYQPPAAPTGSRNLLTLWSRAAAEPAPAAWAPEPVKTPPPAPAPGPSPIRSLGLSPLGAIPLQ